MKSKYEELLKLAEELPIRFVSLPPEIKPYWLSDEKWREVFGTEPPKTEGE